MSNGLIPIIILFAFNVSVKSALKIFRRLVSFYLCEKNVDQELGGYVEK